MRQEFKLPELGENITTGTVTAILVGLGETISLNQPVIELETEKAVVEVPSSVSGKVIEIKASPGQTMNVGDTVFVVETEAKAAAEQPKPAPPREATERPVGKTAEGSTFPEAAAPKRPPERGPAPETKAGPERQPQPKPKLEQREPEPMVAGAATRLVLAAPSVRRLAREMGVELEDVEGTGPNGRVSADDVLDFAHERKQTVAQTEEQRMPRMPELPAQREAPAKEQPAHNTDAWGAIERHPMSAIRRKTASHIASAWQTIPHVTQYDMADITSVEQFRKQYAPELEATGGRLTMTIILTKLMAILLRKYPTFNASVDMGNEEIVFKKYIHIGVAVDTPNGLLVPVVRDADQKGLRQLAIEIPQLARKARDRKLSLEEMQGGTFTITNLGSIGGGHFTPIINAPEVAILGVSRAQMRPVYKDGDFVPRLTLPLSLSYDHRIIDGADAARFLRAVVGALEQPLSLWLDEGAEVD